MDLFFGQPDSEVEIVLSAFGPSDLFPFVTKHQLVGELQPPECGHWAPPTSTRGFAASAFEVPQIFDVKIVHFV